MPKQRKMPMARALEGCNEWIRELMPGGAEAVWGAMDRHVASVGDGSYHGTRREALETSITMLEMLQPLDASIPDLETDLAAYRAAL